MEKLHLANGTAIAYDLGAEALAGVDGTKEGAGGRPIKIIVSNSGRVLQSIVFSIPCD